MYRLSTQSEVSMTTYTTGAIVIGTDLTISTLPFLQHTILSHGGISAAGVNYRNVIPVMVACSIQFRNSFWSEKLMLH